ncbi:MAG: hypothetical protein LUM44_10495 [Pyrinomonadaceae bacterium]|nr:hypothetical protein [Pyrinomonadaceae bacterium]
MRLCFALVSAKANLARLLSNLVSVKHNLSGLLNNPLGKFDHRFIFSGNHRCVKSFRFPRLENHSIVAGTISKL